MNSLTLSNKTILFVTNKVSFFLSYIKQIALMILADLVMLSLAIWSAYSLRLSELYLKGYIDPTAWLFVL